MQPLIADGLGVLCQRLRTTALKRHKLGVLHLVAEGGLDGVLPWSNAELVGLSVPLGAHAAVTLSDDCRPDILLVDDPLWAVELPRPRLARLSHAFLGLVADATVDLISALGALDVVVPDAAPLADMIRRRLEERGVPLGAEVRGARARVVISAGGARGWVDSLQRDDLVVLPSPTADASRLAERANRLGARVLRPLLASAIATRVEALLALQRRMAAPLAPVTHGALALVDPLLVPAPGQIAVDATGAPAHVVDANGALPEATASALAALRITALWRGDGEL
jgi:hypothetical protein